MTCPRCSNRIAPGEFHQCMGPSYHAPWLHDELVRIRELLERTMKANGIQRPENPEAKGRAAKRETRV
jgi:hypothetical protein